MANQATILILIKCLRIGECSLFLIAVSQVSYGYRRKPSVNVLEWE